MRTRWMRMVISVLGVIFLCFSVTLIAQEEETEDMIEAEEVIEPAAEEVTEEVEEAEPEFPEIMRAQETFMGLPEEGAEEGLKESLGLGTTEEEGVQKVIYVVQTGDNLWDIASRFMNSPYYWPKIWERNTFIIDPHLIYPGDVLNLYPTGQKIKLKDAEMGLIEVVQLGEGAEGALIMGGKVQKVVYKETSSTGYIESGDYERAGIILDSLDHKVILGEPESDRRIYRPCHLSYILVILDILA